MAIKLDDRTIWQTTFWTIAGLAFTSQTALVAIVLTLAATNLVSTSIRGSVLAASVLNICLLVILTTSIVFRLRLQSSSLLSVVHSAATVILLLTTHTLTLYCFGWTFVHPNLARSNDPEYLKHITAAGLAIGVIALVTHSTFFALCSVASKSAAFNFGHANSGSSSQRSSPVRSAKEAISMRLTSLTPSPPRFRQPAPARTAESRFSFDSSHQKNSIRSSVNNALRPMTSKTRLLMRHSFTMVDNRSVPSVQRPSVDMVREEDGFENWDTSAVEDVESGPYNISKPAAGRRRLATIPGSRPVSPAKALDGPFPAYDASPEEIPLPDSPIQSPSGFAFNFPNSSETESIMSNFRRPSSSRRPSLPSSQAYIHPLFRSESPGPLPLPSPGTVIVGSPFAGQIVPHDQVLGPRRLQSAQSLRSDISVPVNAGAASINSVRVPTPTSMSSNMPG